MIEVVKAAELIENPPQTTACWIEPQVLPKSSILLFGGPSKVGKSYIGLEFARALTTGDSPFYCSKFSVPSRAKVLLWEQEIGQVSLTKRLETVMLNHRRTEYEQYFLTMSKVPELSLSEKAGVQTLCTILEESQIEVLIIDPIGKVHTYDENDARQIGELFNRLQLIIKANITRGLSIILAHHFRKLPSGFYAKDFDVTSPDNFRGSGRWLSDPDTVITVVKTDDVYDDIPGKGKKRAWLLRSNWTLRHGEKIDDMMIKISPHSEKNIVKIVQKGFSVL
jgi:RecA-family ATPase